MKKIILSVIVIIAFTLYSIYQRGHIVAITPLQIKSNEKQIAQASITPTEAPSILPTSGNTSQPTLPITPTITPKPKSMYKDGKYTGSVADAFYGNLQVEAIITNGKITDVKFLQYPQDRDTSIEINRQAAPLLTQEAITAQNAQVDVVSGATDSSQAFVQSLQDALAQAKQ